MPTFCGHFVPLESFSVILWNAITFVVERPQQRLSLGMTEMRGSCVPANGAVVVAFYTECFAVKIAESLLGVCVASCC